MGYKRLHRVGVLRNYGEPKNSKPHNWDLYWYGFGHKLDYFGMYIGPYNFYVDNSCKYDTYMADIDFLQSNHD